MAAKCHLSVAFMMISQCFFSTETPEARQARLEQDRHRYSQHIDVNHLYCAHARPMTPCVTLVKLHAPSLCLGAHAQARYTVVCLCVCLCVRVYVRVCVCVDCYSCSKMNQVKVKVSIGF